MMIFQGMFQPVFPQDLFQPLKSKKRIILSMGVYLRLFILYFDRTYSQHGLFMLKYYILKSKLLDVCLSGQFTKCHLKYQF